jgi:hypothetical protein
MRDAESGARPARHGTAHGEDTMALQDPGTYVLAVGALGVAAYGVVDASKMVPWIDLAGFERLFDRSGHGGRRWPISQPTTLQPLMPALQAAFGAPVLELLKAQYRGGRSKGDLPRTLRQGVRIGFGLMEAQQVEQVAMAIGLPPVMARRAVTALALERQATLRDGVAVGRASAEDSTGLAQLETAIDARIDAALTLAEVQYATQLKLAATVVALAVAGAVGVVLGRPWYEWLLVGLAAVPLAPVAKDLATALQEATKALKAR